MLCREKEGIYGTENPSVPVSEDIEGTGNSCFNFHMLRHIFATNCIMQGFDMKSLSEILGHSNVSTTMRIYVHSDMERKNS